ncbi:kinase [Nocardia sp. NPDC127579]|uniref:kinase n=1 Tax=Nocardia sp. NPDC127579 TaxID=3345402 RepID=UPI003644F850
MNLPIGVILYGGPASGKDTVTEQLGQVSEHTQLFRRIKIGSGRTAGYRMSTPEHLASLRAGGQVVWENERYGSVYVIDRPELERMAREGLVPVVHIGQAAAIDAIRSTAGPFRWIVVELWCTLEIARERIEARQTGDTAERLHAWAETGHLTGPDLFVDTGSTSAATAAGQIQEILACAHSSSPR